MYMGLLNFILSLFISVYFLIFLSLEEHKLEMLMTFSFLPSIKLMYLRLVTYILTPFVFHKFPLYMLCMYKTKHRQNESPQRSFTKRIKGMRRILITGATINH